MIAAVSYLDLTTARSNDQERALLRIEIYAADLMRHPDPEAVDIACHTWARVHSQWAPSLGQIWDFADLISAALHHRIRPVPQSDGGGAPWQDEAGHRAYVEANYHLWIAIRPDHQSQMHAWIAWLADVGQKAGAEADRTRWLLVRVQERRSAWEQDHIETMVDALRRIIAATAAA